MKRLLLIGFFVIFVTGAVYILNGKKQITRGISGSVTVTSSVPTDEVVIKMREDDYVPSEVVVKKGQTVVFINESKDWRWPASNLHPTHDIYSEFDPKEPVGTGKSWSFRFDKVGEWRMHDHLAPYITGTITVKP